MLRMACLFALSLASTPLSASQFNRDAQAGRATLMRSYANFNIADCSSYPGTVAVVTKPANGTLTQRPGPYVIDVNRFTGTRSRCAGKTIPGVHVYYMARPGFQGTDRFTLRAVYREGLLNVFDSYSVNVR